jgi:hypothetical protein
MFMGNRQAPDKDGQGDQGRRPYARIEADGREIRQIEYYNNEY